MVQTKKSTTPYREWQESEGVPVVEGLIVPDLRGDIPMEKWARKGVKGAFLDLLGAEEAMDAYIVEIPPAGNTEPEKYMFEEETFVVSGRGATTIWLEGGKKHTFEWQEGSVFSPPHKLLAAALQRRAGPARASADHVQRSRHA